MSPNENWQEQVSLHSEESTFLTKAHLIFFCFDMGMKKDPKDIEENYDGSTIITHVMMIHIEMWYVMYHHWQPLLSTKTALVLQQRTELHWQSCSGISLCCG